MILFLMAVSVILSYFFNGKALFKSFDWFIRNFSYGCSYGFVYWIGSNYLSRYTGKHKKRTTKHRPPKEKFVKHKTKAEMMLNSFHRAVDLLEEVIGKGPGTLSHADRKIMDQEFRYMIPNIFLTLDKMGVNVDSIISGLKIRIAEPPTQDNTRRSIASSKG